MEAGGFFSHYGDFFGHPVGATPISRLRQIGYIRSDTVWIVGENLHWTTAEHSTPAETVQAWMDSPEHRKYLLKHRFRDLGVAAIPGTPYDAAQTDGVTVATEYGFRESRCRPGREPRGWTCFPHLGGSSIPTQGTCLAAESPWLYFGFAVPRQNRRSDHRSAARSRYG